MKDAHFETDNQPPSSKFLKIAVLLAAGSLVVLVAIALLLAVSLLTRGSAAPGSVTDIPEVQLAPTAGEPGTLIMVTSRGWQSGETVLVYLVEVEDDTSDGVVYASAIVDENGRMTIGFRYPQDGPWASRTSAFVAVVGNHTGYKAQALFQVLQSTATPTVESDSPTPLPAATELVSATPTLVIPTATATPETPTSTPVPPTDTPTPVPPTLTPTPVPPTPTATPRPPDPTPVRITHWRAEYYNNLNLTGAPRVRNDTKVEFDWGTGSPMKGIQADNFSVRWTRELEFKAKPYRFHVRVDDGVRVWVDGQLIIDQWHESTHAPYTVEHNMSSGRHVIRVEMYERSGSAAIAVWWEELQTYPDWKGEYYANTNLAGGPALIRNDRGIDFNWGPGAPAPGLPADRFSVRWTRRLRYPAGLHRFFVEVDDGARLWVDGQLVINAWRDGAGEVTGDIVLSDGPHDVRLEMYENGGGAMARLWWAQQNQTSFPDWKARYFSNPGLDGDPTYVRNDVAVDFNWGNGAPAPGLPADNFSVQWTRHMDFAAGTYRFCARADDGVSVEMDDQLPYIIREWHDGSGTYCADRSITAGRHKVRVEYFEHSGGALIQFWWQRLDRAEVPWDTIRRLDRALWAPAPAYGALGSRQEFRTFLEQHGIRAVERGNGGKLEIDWEREVLLVAFLGPMPAPDPVLEVARISYEGRDVTVHLRGTTRSGAGGSVDQVMSSPYVLLAVKWMVLPRGGLNIAFLDQDGGLLGRASAYNRLNATAE